MNERINQLLCQAYDQAVPETWTELSSEQLGRIYDKFAELIVKECMTVIKADPEDGDTINCIANLAILKLEKHFGVES